MDITYIRYSVVFTLYVINNYIHLFHFRNAESIDINSCVKIWPFDSCRRIGAILRLVRTSHHSYQLVMVVISHNPNRVSEYNIQIQELISSEIAIILAMNILRMIQLCNLYY